jgi:hypothetical protein
MALSLRHEHRSVVLKLVGCHGHDNDGCGNCLSVTWNATDIGLVNVAARLFLHQDFGRQYVLDGLLKEYEDGWANDEWCSKDRSIKITNGIDVWKHIILETLNCDKTWKMCPMCSEKYNKGELNFGNILFVTPETNVCPIHTMNQ